jgi:Raf kinase inhibitor-like YbhB/YbcL family protein
MRKKCSKSVVMLLALVFPVIFMGCDDGSSGAFTLQSAAFGNNQRLNVKYCYDVPGGENTSLPFHWANPPEDTRSFALIIHDPDGRDFIHWAVFNIPADYDSIDEGASGTAEEMPVGSIELYNEFGTYGYGGPKPPPGEGNHRYIATLYALNVPTVVVPNSSAPKSYTVLDLILRGKVIDSAAITGIYSR